MNWAINLLAAAGALCLSGIGGFILRIILCRCEERNAKAGYIRVYSGYDVYSSYYECHVCGRHYIDWRTLARAKSNDRGGLADEEEVRIDS